MTEVVVSSCEGFKQEIWAGKHTLTADEPAAVSGADGGPSPYELLLSALGACTSMTLHLYAQRKQWALERVEIHLRHNRTHIKDCEGCIENGGYLDQVEKEIIVAGPLSPEQVQRLGEIAEKCPVNQTLHRGIKTSITIRLAPQPPG